MVDIESELGRVLRILDEAVAAGKMPKHLRDEFEDYARGAIRSILSNDMYHLVLEVSWLASVVRDIERDVRERDVAKEVNLFIFKLAMYAAQVKTDSRVHTHIQMLEQHCEEHGEVHES